MNPSLYDQVFTAVSGGTVGAYGVRRGWVMIDV